MKAIGGEDSLPSLVSKGRWSTLALNKLTYSRKMPFGISGLLIDNKHGLAMMPTLIMLLLIMPLPNPMANTVAPA